MPRFHFHLRARGRMHRDLEATELPNLAAAKAHAAAVAEELMLNSDGSGALTDALCAARATRIETSRLLARARGKPQLV